MDTRPKRAIEYGRYFALGQVGLEMVAPLVVGVLLDSWWGTSPWLAVVGAGVGLVGGLLHLVLYLNAAERRKNDSDQHG